MSRYDWAHRSVCNTCQTVGGETHMSGASFWSKMCPGCGEQMRNRKCRAVKKRLVDFVWWKPKTWFAHKIDMEFK